MVLVDTSIWIDHFRRRDPVLANLLDQASVLMHPFIRGELACGNFRDRQAMLNDLAALPRTISATDPEALKLLEGRALWGRGLGWVDVHLLASALLSDCALWTRDERLAVAARHVGVKKYPRPGAFPAS